MPTRLSRSIARLATLLVAGFVGTATAIDLPPGVSAGSSVEGTTEYTLANGLRVLLTPDQSKPTTTVNMTYLVGSRHENYGQTGMAHLLEHMLFRGTPSLPNALAEFSRRGLRANGSTSSDQTNYYASFAADPETLDWYIRWQADAMINASITQEDLDAEMTVVRNEMERGENSPFRVLLQKMQASAFQWHNYANDTIGARSDVENVDIEQLRAFYKLYYQPDNAVLIVSGQFEPTAVLETIGQAFGTIPRPERTLPPEYTVEPVQDGERSVVVRRHGGTPLVAALFHVPAASSPDYVPLDLGVSMLSDTPSGRLYRDLVDGKHAASVFGFTRAMNDPGYSLFGAQLEPGTDVATSLQALNDTLASVHTTPFEQSQLDRIKNKYLSNWAQTYADPASLTSALSEATAAGDWRLFFLERDLTESATLESVQRVIQQYLVASNRTDGRYVPTDEPVRAPASPAVDLKALLEDYKGKESADEVDAFNPTPDNIDAATRRETLDLPNGPVRLALLPKPTRGERVQARLLIQFGNAELLKGHRLEANVTASLLNHGTDTLTRQEIEDRFDALQANVNFSGGGGSLSVNMTTINEHLPALVETVLDVVRNASFPEKEVSQYQSQAISSIKSAMSEPSSLATRALARHSNPWPRDDIRYVPSFEESLEDIQALSREQLVAFHDTFYGAGTIYFTAVGAFEPDAVRGALRTGLEDWRQAPAYTRIDHPYHEVTPETFIIDTPDKANAFFLASMPLEIQDTNPDYAALYLANYLLGSSETSRLWTRVRVEKGLSYDVRSQFNASSFEPSGSWSIYAIHAPQTSQQLQDTVKAELEMVLNQGFSQKEVEQGIHAVLQLRRLARARDATLSSAWINYLQLDRTFEWSEKVDKELAALTADDVNVSLRKWLIPDRLSIALAADESKQATLSDVP